MNKSESKYFRTAQKMDDAFISLLSEKDFDYISVKEICDRANVNRSTFYLHYETIDDLLCECTENITKSFEKYMSTIQAKFDIRDTPVDDWNFVKSEYLIPYLTFIKENRLVFKTATLKCNVLGLNDYYKRKIKITVDNALSKSNISENEKKYMLAFFMGAIFSVIEEWLKNDCEDSVEKMAHFISDRIKRNERQ